jgi:histidine triad (HIT) family protein
MDRCEFCAIVAGSGPAEVIDADEQTMAFLDTSPATVGHALVVPRRHVADLWDMGAELAAPVMVAVHRVSLKIRDTLRPDGLNVLQSTGAAAFQTVFHLLVHLIPRYAGDPLRLPWTPTPGDPATIAEVAARIRGSAA